MREESGPYGHEPRWGQIWSPDGETLTFIRATTHPDYVALATDEEREFDPVSVVHIIEANGSGLRTVAEFGTHT